MRKLVLGLLGATALIVGSSANATETVTQIDSTFLNLFGSSDFGANVAGQTSIADTFNFTLNTDDAADAEVSSISFRTTDIDFTSIYFDVNDLAHRFHQTGFDPDTETWEIESIFLGAGPHTLYVNGDVVGSSHNGSYVGNLNIAAVPEPATWAMMLIGFGAMGLALRRRRQVRAAFQLPA
jgi:PEP-CTERM motif-containing protein